MPFARPTLSELRGQTTADIQSALPGADALLRFSNLAILGQVLAALANGHYGYLDWIARQAVPFTSTDEHLEGWAALKGVTRKAAQPAVGTIVVTGTAGRTVPAGSTFLRGDGFGYVATADATLVGTAGAVFVRAIAVGAAGNAVDGTAFTLAQSISGVNAAGQATGPVTGGDDIETDDALRGRMLAAYASPPQGGSAGDYQEWALAVPGVTRCWVLPNGMGPSTIILYFMMDGAEAAHGGFPQGANGVAAAETRDAPAAGDQLALADAIFVKQPVTPIVYAVAPLPNAIDLTIAGLAAAGASVRAAIAAAVANALLLNARPGGTTNVSAIEAAIAAVNGSDGFVITAITAGAGTITPGAAGNIVSSAGRLPVLGAITFA